MATCVTFTGDEHEICECDLAEALVSTSGGGYVWVDLDRATSDDLEVLHERFGLHELALEDAFHAGQRPKLEHYDGVRFLVLRPMKWVDGELLVGELHVFLGPGFLITIQQGEQDDMILDDLRSRLDQVPLRPDDPMDLLHAIIDRVVDEFRRIVGELEDEAQALELAVFAPDAKGDFSRDIYRAKRVVLQFWHFAEPLVLPVESLAVPEQHADIDDQPHYYFRDVADHLHQVVRRAETMRELMTDALDANLARLGVQQNEDMRKISAWGALFLLPTVLVGVWGMNFTDMPEIDEPWGYPFALSIIVVSCTLLYLRMKRSGWL